MSIKYISTDDLLIANNGKFDHMFVARSGNIGYIQLIFQPSIDLGIIDNDYLVYTVPDNYRPIYYHKTTTVFQSDNVNYSYAGGTATIYENGDVYISGYYGYSIGLWIWVSFAYICK